MIIKTYYEFIFEDINRSKSIVKNRLEEYEKLKTYLTSKNSLGYAGKFTEFLFNGVPYNELINLYSSIIDLKQKNIKFNIDEYSKYEDVLDSISKKMISYKFKNILNKFPKEQKDLIGDPKDLDGDYILLISKLYDVDHEAFIKKISRYKDFYELIQSIERYLSGKIKSFTRDDVKGMLDDDLKLVFENENIIILKTLTHESIVKVGSDTSWCIVASKSTFGSYTKKGQTQYVLIDYTKDIFDIDFKIGFTLSLENNILYAHDVLDNTVKPEIKEILDNNNVDLNKINITPKIDISNLTSKSTLEEIEDLILRGALKDEGNDITILKILMVKYKNVRRTSGYEVKKLIKSFFKHLTKKDDVIFEKDFDKYKTILGDFYDDIKDILINDFILICRKSPSNVFRYEDELLKYYKNWTCNLTDKSPNYFISEVENNKYLADAVLYFASKNRQTKEVLLISHYCKMAKGEKVDLDEVKKLIDSIPKIDKYQYYNYFNIKYHFNINHYYNMDAKDIIPEKVILSDISTSSLNGSIQKLVNCEVVISYTKDYLLDLFNSNFKNVGGKPTIKSDGDKILQGIITPILDSLTFVSRKIVFREETQFPISYKTTISYISGYRDRNRTNINVEVIINNK